MSGDQLLSFLNVCLLQEGKPYVWAAKGPTAFDCSGLVTFCLHAAGGADWRATHSSAKLYEVLQAVASPMPGDLVFYGQPGHITHVMVAWGDGRVFGACGGNASTTTAEEAAKVGARVRFRRAVDYRPDVRGYRRNPLRGDA